jgi:predicted amidohydrolase
MFEVACIQLEARDVSQYEQTEKEILEWIDSLCSEEKVDLLVFPECAWPAYFLRENEEAAELALQRVDALVKTGPTGTNVNDLTVLLVKDV